MAAAAARVETGETDVLTILDTAANWLTFHLLSRMTGDSGRFEDGDEVPTNRPE